MSAIHIALDTLISDTNGNRWQYLIALWADCVFDLQLTWMQFQIRYEFLQLATQYQFGTVFGLCAIVDEQEICMAIVQHGQFRSENKREEKNQ